MDSFVSGEVKGLAKRKTRSPFLLLVLRGRGLLLARQLESTAAKAADQSMDPGQKAFISGHFAGVVCIRRGQRRRGRQRLGTGPHAEI